MFFQHRTFRLAKDASQPQADQDAMAVDPIRGIAAIADGVSSTLFAGRWAQLLAEAVVAEPPRLDDPQSLPRWIGPLREVWEEGVDEDSLAWHQKPKLRDGAASTLLWIELDPANSKVDQQHRLRAFAMGDCCLFHVHQGQVVRAFPLEDSRRFDIDPDVLRSRPSTGDLSLAFDTLTDNCEQGDLLALCSDALAAWALVQLESGCSPQWESFWHLTDEQWNKKIQMLRTNHVIRYDDTTLVLLRIA